MRDRHSLIFVVCTTLLMLLLEGCANKIKMPLPTRLSLQITASPLLNPNTDGEPSALVIRIYELKGVGEFNASDFFTLYDQDRTVLAADLATSREEMEFSPGELRVIERTLDPTTRYIGILAAYRDIDNAVWRTVSPVTAHQANFFVARLGKNEVVVSPGIAKHNQPE